jgi:hypothetical protein
MNWSCLSILDQFSVLFASIQHLMNREGVLEKAPQKKSSGLVISAKSKVPRCENDIIIR